MDDITHVEIINIAPHGPASRIVIHSDTDGEARAFEFRSYEMSGDGMTELWTLGPEVELEEREPLESVFKDGAWPVGAPLTEEEAAELEQRLREELAKPLTYKVLPPSPPYTPKAGEVITVDGTECIVNQVVHTADKLEIAATRLRAALAQPAGSAVLIDMPARDGAG